MAKLTAYARKQTDEDIELEKPASVSVEDLVGAILGGVSRATAARERAIDPNNGGIPTPKPPWDPNFPWTIIFGFWDPPTGTIPWEDGGNPNPDGDDPIPL